VPPGFTATLTTGASLKTELANVSFIRFVICNETTAVKSFHDVSGYRGADHISQHETL
jgi:hypothetical protein